MKNNSKYTREVCFELAKQCKTRDEFRLLRYQAWRVAKDNGWLDDYTWFLSTHEARSIAHSKPRGSTYTREVCFEIAKQFKTRSEFRKGKSQAWRVAQDNGWIDDYTWFLSPQEVRSKAHSKPHKPHGSKYTREVCFELAKKYRTRTEFRLGVYQAWKVAKANGWLDDYTWFHSVPHRTDEEIEKRARKFTRLVDFQRKDNAAYNMARYRGLLPKFTWLSKNVEAAARHYKDAVYVYEFTNTHSAYIGRSIEPKHRDSRHRKPGDSVYEYAKARGVEVPPMKFLCDGVEPHTGAVKECEFMEEYKKNGWILLNKCKGGSLGQIGTGHLTHDKCISTAKKYEYIKDFMHDHMSMYTKMRATGWIAECPWLKYVLPRKKAERAKRGSYLDPVHGKENVRKVAAKCSGRWQFSKTYARAYNVAKDMGWLDEFFPDYQQKRKVGKVDPVSNKVIEIYSSAGEAEAKNGVARQSVGCVCRGQRNHCKGMVFRYLDDNNNPIEYTKPKKSKK